MNGSFAYLPHLRRLAASNVNFVQICKGLKGTDGAGVCLFDRALGFTVQLSETFVLN